MAAPSAQTLQRLAGETGHQAGTLEKVLRLLDLLQEIARDRVLADRLVLKGGTALNLFHLGLERLSVDIDLNYVGALDRAAMEAERPDVDAALDRLFASQGYGIRRRPDEHAGGKWLARYASALGGNATLEVDVNYMARQPLFGMARMESLPLGRMRAKDVLVLDLHEIVAGKLVALIDRHAARDLFDARRILSVDGLDWDLGQGAVLAPRRQRAARLRTSRRSHRRRSARIRRSSQSVLRATVLPPPTVVPREPAQPANEVCKHRYRISTLAPTI